MAASLTAKAGGTQGALQVNGTDSVVFDATGITSGGTNIINTTLGYNQTWKSNTLTITRAFGTTYTNTTGRPIFVHVALYASVASTSVTTNFTIDGVVRGVGYSFNNIGTDQNMQHHVYIIPAGSTYSVSAGGTLASWSELS